MKKEKLGNFTDKRGILMWASPKILNFKYKYLTIGTMKPNSIRGNHYHKRTKELFLCIHGSLTVKLGDEKVQWFTLEAGDYMEFPLNIKHTVYNQIPEIASFIEFKSEEYNKNEPDTYQ